MRSHTLAAVAQTKLFESRSTLNEAPLAVDTSGFRHRPLPHLLAGRSVGETAPLPKRLPLKPSKLIPLEVGRHEGDKA